MTVSSTASNFVISVVPSLEQRALGSLWTLEAQAMQVAKLLDAYKFVATWGIPTKDFLSVTPSAGNELALLPDGQDQQEMARAKFVEWLGSERSLAASHEVQVASIVAEPNVAQRHADLLVKKGISVVMTCGDNGGRAEVSAHSIRWGLWKLQPTSVIRNGATWFPLRAGHSSARHVFGPLADQATIHLQIELTGRDTCRAVNNVLLKAANLIAMNKLVHKSLSSLADELTLGRKARSTESILRRAA